MFAGPRAGSFVPGLHFFLAFLVGGNLVPPDAIRGFILAGIQTEAQHRQKKYRNAHKDEWLKKGHESKNATNERMEEQKLLRAGERLHSRHYLIL
jgi:hypothetical protein